MVTEETVLSRLGSALTTVDPVPAAALDLALASISLRDPDAALAELVADSLTGQSAVRTGPAAGPRLLTFTAGELTVEVEVAETGGTRRVLGQIVPPQPADVTVRWHGGDLRVAADEVGRFAAESVPSGPVSMTCHLADRDHPVTTSWVSV